jgi:hypothetical protein
MARNDLTKGNLNCSEPHPVHGTDRKLNLFTNSPEGTENTPVKHMDGNLSAWSCSNS